MQSGHISHAEGHAGGAALSPFHSTPSSTPITHTACSHQPQHGPSARGGQGGSRQGHAGCRRAREGLGEVETFLLVCRGSCVEERFAFHTTCSAEILNPSTVVRVFGMQSACPRPGFLSVHGGRRNPPRHWLCPAPLPTTSAISRMQYQRGLGAGMGLSPAAQAEMCHRQCRLKPFRRRIFPL